MSSPEPRNAHLTAGDFIAYGMDSFNDAPSLTDSTSAVLAESAECIPGSASQTTKRGKLRPEQKATGTPQWYIKKVQDKTASRKQMADLQALLQGTDIEYVAADVVLYAY
jgi:hypothetical protein